MKNPTAKLLWNFLIIMVPPILKNKSMLPLHKAAKPSEKTRVDVTNKLMITNIPDITNIAYLQINETRSWEKELPQRNEKGREKRNHYSVTDDTHAKGTCEKKRTTMLQSISGRNRRKIDPKERLYTVPVDSWRVFKLFLLLQWQELGAAEEIELGGNFIVVLISVEESSPKKTMHKYDFWHF